MPTLDDFWKKLAEFLNVPRSNLAFIEGWQPHEGGWTRNSATYNPLNTSLVYGGSESMGDGSHIQAYPDIDTGVIATARTLEWYPGIMAAIRTGNIDRNAIDPDLRKWVSGNPNATEETYPGVGDYVNNVFYSMTGIPPAPNPVEVAGIGNIGVKTASIPVPQALDNIIRSQLADPDHNPNVIIDPGSSSGWSYFGRPVNPDGSPAKPESAKVLTPEYVPGPSPSRPWLPPGLPDYAYPEWNGSRPTTPTAVIPDVIPASNALPSPNIISEVRAADPNARAYARSAWHR